MPTTTIAPASLSPHAEQPPEPTQPQSSGGSRPADPPVGTEGPIDDYPIWVAFEDVLTTDDVNWLTRILASKLDIFPKETYNTAMFRQDNPEHERLLQLQSVVRYMGGRLPFP